MPSGVWKGSGSDEVAGTIFDTSVYINALRRRDLSAFAQTRIADEEGGNEPLYLSTVVLEEFYVGAIFQIIAEFRPFKWKEIKN